MFRRPGSPATEGCPCGAAGFRPPAGDAKLVPVGRPGHFLLLAQEKVTKENGTPRGAGRATPSQSVRGGRAFRPGSCPDEKCPTSVSGTPAGPHRPPLTAPQGLGEGSCRGAAHRNNKTARLCRSAPSARPQRSSMRRGRALGALLQGRAPLLIFPPLWREQAGGGIARRVAGRTPARGSSGQDALSIHPASRLRPRRGATSGWPLFWLLFSGHAEKSDPADGSPSEARRPTGTPFGRRRARSRKHRT